MLEDVPSKLLTALDLALAVNYSIVIQPLEAVAFQTEHSAHQSTVHGEIGLAGLLVQRAVETELKPCLVFKIKPQKMEELNVLVQVHFLKVVTPNVASKIVPCLHGVHGLHVPTVLLLETDPEPTPSPRSIHVEDKLVSKSLILHQFQTLLVPHQDVPGLKDVHHVPQETVLDTTTQTEENVSVPLQEMMDTLSLPILSIKLKSVLEQLVHTLMEQSSIKLVHQHKLQIVQNLVLKTGHNGQNVLATHPLKPVITQLLHQLQTEELLVALPRTSLLLKDVLQLPTVPILDHYVLLMLIVMMSWHVQLINVLLSLHPENTTVIGLEH